jgi:Cytosolic domain of 10TM putative phosphate transporter
LKGVHIRQTVIKRKCCMMRSIRIDAEEYYRDKITETTDIIKKEKERKQKSNGGFGFVTFQSNLQVKKCLLASQFKKMVMENLSPEERLVS